MTDLQFMTEKGSPLSVVGGYANLDGEFVPWMVRWDGDALYASLGGTPLPLVRRGDGCFSLPKDGKNRRDVRFAGEVRLYADSLLKSELLPRLWIHSADMSDEDYRTIVLDLKELARELSVTLGLVAASRDVSDSGSDAPSPFTVRIRFAKAAQTCLDAYAEQLPIIAEHPVRALRIRTQLMESERAARLGMVQQVSKWPQSRRHVPVPAREYSTDTPERRFVFATLNEACVRAGWAVEMLRRWLEVRDKTVREEDETVGRETAVPAAAVVPGLGIEDIAGAEKVRESLEETCGRLSSELPDELPGSESIDIRTNRLQMSPDFSPLVDAWEAFNRAVPIATRHSETASELGEYSIAKTNLLYERWVTLRIYKGLVDRGFHPPEGERSLLDTLRIVGGDLQFERLYKLTRRCSGKTVDLTFEVQAWPEEKHLHPDLVITAKVGEKFQTWVIDAKYRNYHLHAPSFSSDLEKTYGSHLLGDLVGVAEVKYRRNLGATVSAIVHPGVGPRFNEYEKWDELMRQRVHPELTADTPHAVLAVPLRPGSEGDKRVTKLFRLLFAFHLGLVATCWQCGKDCEGRRRRPDQGTYYFCGECRAGWKVTHCCNPECRREPLLKFYSGEQLHKMEDEGSGNVTCPWCAVDLHGWSGRS